MKIKIITDQNARDHLEDSAFIEQWLHLEKQSEPRMLTQEYEFVSSWYIAYTAVYLPVLILGYDNKKVLRGILPLALKKSDGRLTHAGDGLAEYHGWISSKVYEQAFLIQSVIAIQQQLEISNWQWLWMPPNANTAWVESDELKKHGIFISTTPCDSPVYQLNDTDRIQQIARHRSLKTSINRLKKAGELKIELVSDVEEVQCIFSDLENQNNFRNLALYNYQPFKKDPYRKKWLLERIKQSDAVKLVVLKQGDKSLACSVVYCSEDTVTGIIFSFDPTASNSSPGNIFFLMFIPFLREKGFHYFDLTPGGGAYKERFCNTHTRLLKIMISFNRVAYLKQQTFMMTKVYAKQLSKGKLDNRILINIRLLMRKGLITTLMQKVYYRVFNHQQASLCEINTQQLNPIETGYTVKMQQYSDLLLYCEQGEALAHKELISNALRSFQRGDSLYTISFSGSLMAYAWLARSGRKHWHPCLKNRIQTGKDCYIYDVYLKRQNQNSQLLNKIIHRIVKDVSNNSSSRLYIVKPSNGIKLPFLTVPALPLASN